MHQHSHLKILAYPAQSRGIYLHGDRDKQFTQCRETHRKRTTSDIYILQRDRATKCNSTFQSHFAMKLAMPKRMHIRHASNEPIKGKQANQANQHATSSSAQHHTITLGGSFLARMGKTCTSFAKRQNTTQTRHSLHDVVGAAAQRKRPTTLIENL